MAEFDRSKINLIQVPLSTAKVKTYYSENGERFNANYEYEGREVFKKNTIHRYTDNGEFKQKYLIKRVKEVPGVSHRIERYSMEDDLETISWQIENQKRFLLWLDVYKRNHVETILSKMKYPKLLYFSTKQEGDSIYLAYGKVRKWL